MTILRTIETEDDNRHVVDEYPPDYDSAEVARMSVYDKVLRQYSDTHTVRFTDEGAKWTIVVVGGPTITMEIAESFDVPVEDA